MPPNPILPLAPLLLSPVLDEENQAAIQSTEWVSLGLSRSVVALEKNTQDQLIALGMDGSLFRLGSSGRWINLLKKEEDVVNPEDLLLDAESTMSEILEGVSVEESYFDEETEELIIEESQASFEDEIQGGVFDPLREDGGKFDKRPALWSFDDVIVYCIESCRESLNRGRTWSDLRIPRIHEIVEYIIDEKAYLVAATETGIWLRERSARKWELASVSLRNFSFYDLLQKDGTLIATSNMGVFRSSNSLFWNRINTRSDIQQFEEVSEGILAVLDDGLALSVDGGETFTALMEKEYTNQLKDLTILGLKSQDENVYL
ncbi:MAG: hypothetical protein VX278_22795, partial [Myxococcota bacterium]|nr:hypothetical protein [Myxococcota bacterium]